MKRLERRYGEATENPTKVVEAATEALAGKPTAYKAATTADGVAYVISMLTPLMKRAHSLR